MRQVGHEAVGQDAGWTGTRGVSSSQRFPKRHTRRAYAAIGTLACSSPVQARSNAFQAPDQRAQRRDGGRNLQRPAPGTGRLAAPAVVHRGAWRPSERGWSWLAGASRRPGGQARARGRLFCQSRCASPRTPAPRTRGACASPPLRRTLPSTPASPKLRRRPAAPTPCPCCTTAGGRVPVRRRGALWHAALGPDFARAAGAHLQSLQPQVGYNWGSMLQLSCNQVHREKLQLAPWTQLA